MTAPHLLIVDDDPTFRMSTAALLREDGHDVDEAADGQAAIERLKSSDFDLILLDLRMPGLDGIGIVEVLRTWGEDTPILMISGFGTVDAAVEALHTGADDFLTKPVEPDVLSARVDALLARRPSVPSAGAEPPGGLLGRSPSMRTILEIITRVAPTEATVLVTGETGTGKELVARAIHELSDRTDGPFLAVNCAALAEGVLESELFGHVRGAFTGAARDRSGLFSAADGGTLLLDEIGDVSLGMQHRLLRVLQEREFTPVGAVKPVSVDVRIVAATNRDLRAEMEAGRFHDDLYYRLNVVRVEVPPLRERREDIPLIAESFFRRVDLPPHGRAPRSRCVICKRIGGPAMSGSSWRPWRAPGSSQADVASRRSTFPLTYAGRALLKMARLSVIVRRGHSSTSAQRSSGRSPRPVEREKPRPSGSE